MAEYLFPYKHMLIPCGTCGHKRKMIDGESLRAARLVRGVGLREMAKRCDLSAAYLSDVERNRRAVTDNVLRLYQTVMP